MTTATSKQTRKPVILQVLPALETGGGVERGTVEIAAALTEAGYEALAASALGGLVKKLESVGGRHIALPLQSKNPAVIRRNTDALRRTIRKHNVALVHARSRAPAWSAYRAARAEGVPFVTTFHAPYNFSAQPVLKQAKKAYNAVMAKGDLVIAISGFVARHMEREYGVDPARIRIIHRGVDVRAFSPEDIPQARVDTLRAAWNMPQDGLPVLMLPGRLTRWKGQELLLRAAAQMRQPTRVVLVGPDQGRAAYSSHLRILAQELGLGERVALVGACTDMPAALMLSDMVISASTDPEGFGRVAVEGQAMGRLVAAPAHGAAPEQINSGENGWLFQPGDAADLGRVLDEALSLSPEQRSVVQRQAITNVRDCFTTAGMCAKTLAVYQELLDR